MKKSYKVTFKYEYIEKNDYDNPIEAETTIIIEAQDIGEAFTIVMRDDFYSEVSEPVITAIVEGVI
jgi:hypothetical protein